MIRNEEKILSHIDIEKALNEDSSRGIFQSSSCDGPSIGSKVERMLILSDARVGTIVVFVMRVGYLNASTRMKSASFCWSLVCVM